MALSLKSLVRQGTAAPVGLATGLPRAAAVSLFTYATDDAAATVETAAYFNNARAILNVGDHIDASMVMAGTPVAKKYICTVVPKTTGNVVVVLQTTTAG
jgi:hypothetical protein